MLLSAPLDDEVTGHVAGVHDCVTRFSCSTPDATALTDGRREVSYAELDALSDSWAQELRTLGVSAGDRVPLLLPRSIELVIAIVGALKTGAVYAVLDPCAGPEVLAPVFDDLDARVTIAGHGSEAVVAGLGRLWTTGPEPDAPSAPVQPAHTSSDSDPCCVFFTSGTAGRPKGVIVTHAAILRLFTAPSFVDLGPDSVVSVAAPPQWDAFCFELWAGLTSGGTCLIVTEPFLTGTLIRLGRTERRLNTVWLTSSLFNAIVDDDLGAFDGLRHVLTGGERLSRLHVRRFLERHPNILLSNGYGPVETTVFAAVHPIAIADCDYEDGIPVGRPVPSTGIYVLHDDELCAPGQIGEICISGSGLALGYLNDARLTAEKFPTVVIAGRALRLYRTGDLGVLRDDDGPLEYRGRMDRQVKIRGHRVDLGDVEARVRSILRIDTCQVVVARDVDDEADELIVFVPLAAGHAPDLQRRLVDSLSAAERPTHVELVSRWPLTERGKVDRAALLAGFIRTRRPPARHDSVLAVSTVSTDPLDIVLAAYCALLDPGLVDPERSFFESGGSSLQAGRLCAALTRTTGVPLALSTFFENATPRALAAVLGGPTDSVGRVPSPTDEVPLSSFQRLLLLTEILHPGTRSNHCLLQWCVQGPIDVERLRTAATTLNARHAALHSAYRLDPSATAVPVVGVGPDFVKVGHADDEDAARRAVLVALSRPLDVSLGHTWRLVLATYGEPGGGVSTVVAVAVHHVAFDGWSEHLLSRELTETYRGDSKGGVEAHPRPVEDGRRGVTSARLRRLAGELRGCGRVVWPDLPDGLDRPTPAAAVGTLESDLKRGTLRTLDEALPHIGGTRFGAFLALWSRAVAEVSKADDFCVGVPVSRRSSAEEASAIGCLVTVLPVRVGSSVLHTPVTDAIRALSGTLLRTFACQDVELDELFVSAAADRGGPLYQTLFALQDNPVPSFSPDGLPSRFRRLPYLQLPNALHGEVWHDERGSLTLQVSHRLSEVGPSTARAVAAAFERNLDTLQRDLCHG